MVRTSKTQKERPTEGTTAHIDQGPIKSTMADPRLPAGTYSVVQTSGGRKPP